MNNEKQFRAVTIVTRSSKGRVDLTDAFNTWVKEEQPLAIIHIHYFHDSETHQRGYQIVYEARANAAAAAAA